jgi:hypothetical protein
MTAKWFNIINKNDFLDLDLPSKELELNLTDIGVKTILVTSGVGVSLVYEGIQLMVGLNDRNPFSFEGHAVYLDSNNDIWLGIEDA